MTSLLVITEGGSAVGLGHIRRCLTLADALVSEGMDVSFRVAGGDAAEAVVRKAGFSVDPIREPPDAVLIDSYSANQALFLEHPSARTVVIDDLADRPLPVDLVINPALGAGRLDYARITNARLLLGAEYALLRPEFRNAPARRTSPRIERVMITLGGGDRGALLSDVVRWCIDAFPKASLDVVAGPFMGNVDERNACVTILREPNMRDVMLRADIAICSGGQTLFELAATGLPGIAIATASNQAQNLADFEAAGTIRVAGKAGDVELRDRFRDACAALEDPAVREGMAERGQQLVDGLGAQRAAAAILELLETA